MEHRRCVPIVNPKGLHARPSHAFVSRALEFEATVRVRCSGIEVNGKSILELMTLGAACESELELCCTGPDAEAALAALVALVESGFDE
ncbi:MAG: HPr family phosphocarrier protein [Planctomycetota bacterium]|nr:HPr family phosphocarrier protein [Planctomycetota bacterium]